MTHIRQFGFTLIELIVVLIIVGILAVAVAPRFFARQTYEARGFFDQTLSALRYAQKTAIAKRRNVCVTVLATSISLSYDAVLPDDGHVPNCAGGPLNPALIGSTGGVFSIAAPSGVTPTTVSFSFTSAGKPYPDASVAINITAAGEPTRTATIDRETGYVH